MRAPLALPCDGCVGRSTNICKPLDPTHLLVMLGLGGMRRWKRREMLFRSGDAMSAFFKIRSGIVAVSRALDDGRRQIVALRVPGDCLGYLETDGKYCFEGEALTDVEACAFDRRRFDAFAAEQPRLASAVVETLSAALKQTGEAMLVLGQLRSTERLAHFLAEFDSLYRARTGSTAPVSLRMSRREIADYLGLTVETVSRAIGQLRQQRLIDRHGVDTIIVLNNRGLRRIGKVRSTEPVGVDP